MERAEICGTCKYHRNVDREWICLCEEADEYGLETEYSHHCEEHERREE